MGHGIRRQLILTFISVAVGPVLTVGAVVALLSYRAELPVPVLTIFAITGIAAAAAAGISAALALWIAGRIVQPLQVMTEVAEAMVSGDLTPQSPVVSDDEIGILAGTFNHMARKLRDRIGALETRATERTKALAVFHDISRMSTLPDEKRLAVEAAERVKNAFHYYRVRIYFLDEAGENLILADGTGQAGQSASEEGFRLSKGEGPAGRAAESNMAVLVGDTARESGGRANPRLPKVKSEIAIPIAAGDEVLGVLDVQQNIVDGVTQADAEILQPIADQIAILVRNARLLARVWQQAERKDLIAFIGQKIQQTTAMEDALRVTARELGRALGSRETRVVLFELPPANQAQAESGPGYDK
jgi:nitrate/nitrite-specific signal transduction histidine kinase